MSPCGNIVTTIKIRKGGGDLNHGKKSKTKRKYP